METNKLWNPTKRDQARINAGQRKERLGHLRLAGLLTEVDCKFCGKSIYLTPGKHGVKLLTLGGSEHKCVGMKK